MGWFKKLTGVSTPSALKKVDDQAQQAGNKLAKQTGLYGNDSSELLKKGAIAAAVIAGGAGLAGIGPLAGALGGVGSSIGSGLASAGTSLGGMFGGGATAAGAAGSGGMSLGSLASGAAKDGKIGGLINSVTGLFGGGTSQTQDDGWVNVEQDKGLLGNITDWIGGALGGKKQDGFSGILQNVAGQYIGNKLGEQGINIGAIGGGAGGGTGTGTGSGSGSGTGTGTGSGSGSGSGSGTGTGGFGAGGNLDLYQLQAAALDKNYAQQIENNNLRHQMAMQQLQKPMIPINDPVADMQRYFGGNPMAQDVNTLMANYGRTQR